MPNTTSKPGQTKQVSELASKQTPARCRMLFFFWNLSKFSRPCCRLTKHPPVIGCGGTRLLLGSPGSGVCGLSERCTKKKPKQSELNSNHVRGLVGERKAKLHILLAVFGCCCFCSFVPLTYLGESFAPSLVVVASCLLCFAVLMLLCFEWK